MMLTLHSLMLGRCCVGGEGWLLEIKVGEDWLMGRQQGMELDGK